MSEALLRAEAVSRVFHAGSEAVHALEDVSLTAATGQFVAVVGRSGSGKTTLLNILGGLDRPDSGRVWLGDSDLTAMSEDDLTKLRRVSIGFVFQSFGLLPLLSAYENVELALRIAGAGVRQRGERTREMLDLVGLSKRARHRPYELSGGEQQRVAVARALANRPQLLIADEPTGELDSHTAAQIFELLQRVAREQGTCIVASTHDPSVRDAADRVETLVDGRLAPGGGGERGPEARVTGRPGEPAGAEPDAPVAVAADNPAPAGAGGTRDGAPEAARGRTGDEVAGGGGAEGYDETLFRRPGSRAGREG